MTHKERADAAEARAEQAEREVRELREGIEALAILWERGEPEGPAAIHFCPELRGGSA